MGGLASEVILGNKSMGSLWETKRVSPVSEQSSPPHGLPRSHPHQPNPHLAIPVRNRKHKHRHQHRCIVRLNKGWCASSAIRRRVFPARITLVKVVPL